MGKKIAVIGIGLLLALFVIMMLVLALAIDDISLWGNRYG